MFFIEASMNFIIENTFGRSYEVFIKDFTEYLVICRLVNMSQEHGCVSVKNGQIDCSAYPLNSMLFIYPYHVSIPPFILQK